MKRFAKAQGRVVGVPVVVEPVPVQDRLAAVLDEIRNIEIAVAVLNKCIECRLFHCPLNSLGAVFYSAS